MPLFMANPGDLVKVTRVTGQDDVRRHLAELGFVEDAEVLVVSNIKGDMIVQVKGARVALNRSMASRIFF